MRFEIFLRWNRIDGGALNEHFADNDNPEEGESGVKLGVLADSIEGRSR